MSTPVLTQTQTQNKIKKIKIREIENYLFQFAPKELAMDWDNVGLLIGDPDMEVTRALIALDITDITAREAIEKDCNLIISHHPVMNCHWNPVQNIRQDTPQGKLLIKLLKNNIAAICMHTNLDRTKGGVNDCLAEKLNLLNWRDLPGGDGFCRMGNLAESTDLKIFVREIKNILHCNGVRYADGGKKVLRIATGGGACGEYAQAAFDAGCDTFVTADIKYHDFLDAAAMGLNLIDAGHFPTENLICEKLIEILSRQFPDLFFIKSEYHREIINYI